MVLEIVGAVRDFDSEAGELHWPIRRAFVVNGYFGHFPMRKIIVALAVLYPAAAFAQATTPPAPAATPPMVGGKPLVQVGPKKTAAAKKEAPAKPLSPAQKLQACQEIDDATKERLNCYDAVYTPQTKAKVSAAKNVSDCRFLKEEDERLTCFNGFVDKLPLLPR